MEPFDSYIIFSDYDGTLGRKKVISEKNLEAVRYFQQNGGLFTIATGRFREFFRSFEPDFVPNTYMITSSGAIIYDINTDEIIYKRPADRAILDTVCEALPLMQGVLDVLLFSENDSVKIDFSEPDLYERIRSVPFTVLKVLIHVPRAQELSDIDKKILEQIAGDRYIVTRSWVGGVEIQARDSDKGHAIDHVMSLLGEEGKKRKIICIGDYENDISMFDHVDVSYAVEDAFDAGKERATRVTVPFDQDAIAALIADIENGRI